MTTKLSDDLREALEQESSSPVHLVDATTNAKYVIMRADQYDRIKAQLDEKPFDPRELYSLVEASFLRAGWDDPEMDVYNDYDAHRSKP
jgi:hypothetical protein